MSQRTREIGVRLALGARMNDILALVLGEGAKQAVLGIVLGLLCSVVASRALQSLLYGVKGTDGATLGGVVVLIAMVTVGACLPPAWRATRVDPLLALRQD